MRKHEALKSKYMFLIRIQIDSVYSTKFVPICTTAAAKVTTAAAKVVVGYFFFQKAYQKVNM